MIELHGSWKTFDIIISQSRNLQHGPFVEVRFSVINMDVRKGQAHILRIYSPSQRKRTKLWRCSYDIERKAIIGCTRSNQKVEKNLELEDFRKKRVKSA